MILSVHWVNATRLPEEAHAIENLYAERMLDLFDTPEAAYAAKEQWHRKYEPPVHPWTTYNRICFLDATSRLLPSERGLAHFVVRFS